MKGLKMMEETIFKEIKGIARDVGGEMSSIVSYDNADVKGLLDNVNSTKVKAFVDKARPIINRYIDEIQKTAIRVFNQGKEQFEKIKEEVEKEVSLKGLCHSILASFEKS